MGQTEITKSQILCFFVCLFFVISHLLLHLYNVYLILCLCTNGVFTNTYDVFFPSLALGSNFTVSVSNMNILYLRLCSFYNNMSIAVI